MLKNLNALNDNFDIKPLYDENLKPYDMCSIHTQTRLGYLCKVDGSYYCKHCVHQHYGHDDMPLSVIQLEI